jgi:hypothetical protein
MPQRPHSHGPPGRIRAHIAVQNTWFTDANVRRYGVRNGVVSISGHWFLQMGTFQGNFAAFLAKTENDVVGRLTAFKEAHPEIDPDTDAIIIMDIERPHLADLHTYSANDRKAIVDAYRRRIAATNAVFPDAKLSLYGTLNPDGRGRSENPTYVARLNALVEAGRDRLYDDLDYVAPFSMCGSGATTRRTAHATATGTRSPSTRAWAWTASAQDVGRVEPAAAPAARLQGLQRQLGLPPRAADESRRPRPGRGDTGGADLDPGGRWSRAIRILDGEGQQSAGRAERPHGHGLPGGAVSPANVIARSRQIGPARHPEFLSLFRQNATAAGARRRFRGRRGRWRPAFLRFAGREGPTAISLSAGIDLRRFTARGLTGFGLAGGGARIEPAKCARK